MDQDLTWPEKAECRGWLAAVVKINDTLMNMKHVPSIGDKHIFLQASHRMFQTL